MRSLVRAVRRRLLKGSAKEPLDLAQRLADFGLEVACAEPPAMDRTTREPEDFLSGRAASYRYFLENGVECCVNYAPGWRMTGIGAHAICATGTKGMSIEGEGDLAKLAAWIKERSRLTNGLRDDARPKDVREWLREKGIEARLAVDGVLTIENGTRLVRDDEDGSWMAERAGRSGALRMRYPDARSAASCEALRMMNEKGEVVRPKAAKRR